MTFTTFDVDFYLRQLGPIGKYQIYVYVFSLFPAMMYGMVILQNVFIMGIPKHRCFVENCDTDDSAFDSTLNWINQTLPWHEHDSPLSWTDNIMPDTSCCHIYKTIPSNETDNCFGKVDKSVKLSCNRFVYDKQEFGETVVSKWNLICSNHWMSTLSGSLFMGGILVGSIIFGLISDKFGRRHVFYYVPLAAVLASLVQIFSTNILTFTLANIIIAALSYGMFLSSFVLGIELIGGQYSVWCANGYQAAAGFGEIVLAVVAFCAKDWKILAIFIACLNGCMLLLLL